MASPILWRMSRRLKPRWSLGLPLCWCRRPSNDNFIATAIIYGSPIPPVAIRPIIRLLLCSWSTEPDARPRVDWVDGVETIAISISTVLWQFIGTPQFHSLVFFLRVSVQVEQQSTRDCSFVFAHIFRVVRHPRWTRVNPIAICDLPAINSRWNLLRVKAEKEED